MWSDGFLWQRRPLRCDQQSSTCYSKVCGSRKIVTRGYLNITILYSRLTKESLEWVYSNLMPSFLPKWEGTKMWNQSVDVPTHCPQHMTVQFLKERKHNLICLIVIQLAFINYMSGAHQDQHFLWNKVGEKFSCQNPNLKLQNTFELHCFIVFMTIFPSSNFRLERYCKVFFNGIRVKDGAGNRYSQYRLLQGLTIHVH